MYALFFLLMHYMYFFYSLSFTCILCRRAHIVHTCLEMIMTWKFVFCFVMSQMKIIEHEKIMFHFAVFILLWHYSALVVAFLLETTLKNSNIFIVIFSLEENMSEVSFFYWGQFWDFFTIICTLSEKINDMQRTSENINE